MVGLQKVVFILNTLVYTCWLVLLLLEENRIWRERIGAASRHLHITGLVLIITASSTTGGEQDSGRRLGGGGGDKRTRRRTVPGDSGGRLEIRGQEREQGQEIRGRGRGRR